MSTALSLLPRLVVAALGIWLVVSIVQIWRRHQHAQRLALQALSTATLMGLIGITGIIPDSLWWLTWSFALAILLGIAASSRRLLRRTPPTAPSPRQATLLEPPARSSGIAEIVFWLALVVLALVAG